MDETRKKDEDNGIKIAQKLLRLSLQIIRQSLCWCWEGLVFSAAKPSIYTSSPLGFPPEFP